ncbi:MAG: hypothetical protein AAF827_19290 [Cyanobacteria bacterium P01_D01_bin.6]
MLKQGIQALIQRAITLALWLSAEVILTSIGLDDLADYGEYHVTSKQAAIAQLVQTAPIF